jgi:hypothetical protein
MMVWEREIYVKLLMDHIEEQKNNRNANPYNWFK